MPLLPRHRNPWNRFHVPAKGKTPAERPCPDAWPPNKSSPLPGRFGVHARTSPGKTTPPPSIPRQPGTAPHCAPAIPTSCPAPADSRKTRRPQRTPPLPRPQITDAINRRERRQQQGRQKKPRRKWIELNEKFAERHRPGKIATAGPRRPTTPEPPECSPTAATTTVTAPSQEKFRPARFISNNDHRAHQQHGHRRQQQRHRAASFSGSRW